jgi:L-alanine-DL-glutamate epimerase-like enolase superfamily enzyme
MKIGWRIVELHLKHPFTIARGSSTVRRTVIVECERDGIIGYGEAAPIPRYGESPESVVAFLERLDPRTLDSPFALEETLADLDAQAPGETAAKAAVDIALHDWVAKSLGVPLWKLWGLTPARAPLTSFTIGIDTPAVIEQKLKEAEPFPILKVKVGVPGDEEIVKLIRRHSDKTIRADANEGWRKKEEALEKLLMLAEQRVEFVEQPMPASQLDDIVWLRERSPLPLIADESVRSLADLPTIRAAFDGINIKLMKSAGLREATRMIHAARALGMKVMLGCMIESSVGVAAAAHLLPLADFADLDGNILIDDDPFEGLGRVAGRIVLGEASGLGVHPRHSRT